MQYVSDHARTPRDQQSKRREFSGTPKQGQENVADPYACRTRSGGLGQIPGQFSRVVAAWGKEVKGHVLKMEILIFDFHVSF